MKVQRSALAKVLPDGTSTVDFGDDGTDEEGDEDSCSDHENSATRPVCCGYLARETAAVLAPAMDTSFLDSGGGPRVRCDARLVGRPTLKPRDAPNPMKALQKRQRRLPNDNEGGAALAAAATTPATTANASDASKIDSWEDKEQRAVVRSYTWQVEITLTVAEAEARAGVRPAVARRRPSFLDDSDDDDNDDGKIRGGEKKDDDAAWFTVALAAHCNMGLGRLREVARAYPLNQAHRTLAQSCSPFHGRVGFESWLEGQFQVGGLNTSSLRGRF